MSFDADDVKRVVLAQSDFRFELQVGHVFDAVPGSIDVFNPTYVEPAQYAGTYSDPATGKTRSFDYRWKIARGDTAARDIKCALLAVECRNLDAGSPMVICGHARRDGEAFSAFIESRYDNTTAGRACTTKKTDQSSPFYPPGAFVGKSILRLRGTHDGLTAFNDPGLAEKGFAALASSVGLAESACVLSRKGWNVVNSMVIPVVVVPDDCLWTMEFDNAGEARGEPAKTDSCHYYAGKKISLAVPGDTSKPFVLSHVHFLTLSGFRAFLTRLKQEKNIWSQMFPDSASELV